MRRAMATALLLTVASPALAEDAREMLADQARITPAQAERTALKQHAGHVHEIELKVRHGKPVFQVKFSDGRRVLVDAVSGTVVRINRPVLAEE